MYSEIDAVQVHCLKSIIKDQPNRLCTITFTSVILAANKNADIGVTIQMVYVVKTYTSDQHIISEKYNCKTMHIFRRFIKPV